MARPARQPVSRRVARPAEVAGVYCLDLGAGGVLLSSPLACQDVLTALAGAVRDQRSTGVPVRPEVLDLMATLSARLDALRAVPAAPDCRTRQASLPPGPGSASWEAPAELVTVSEAARLLGLKPRRVRDYLADGRLPGTKRGGTWLVELSAVLAAAQSRREQQ
ncbi:helix-turn-helix domain-containing protein [Geodermatophilus sp. SYSU D00079]